MPKLRHVDPPPERPLPNASPAGGSGSPMRGGSPTGGGSPMRGGSPMGGGAPGMGGGDLMSELQARLAQRRAAPGGE